MKAQVIQDSVSKVTGVRLITLQLEYPRFIHAEFLTHRLLSRNSSSSRAQPSDSVISRLNTDEIVLPVHWGKNKSGMQAEEELSEEYIQKAEKVWRSAAADAVIHQNALSDLKVHKQITNRITEPFQNIATVVSATQWSNFFALRNHSDAQPEIQALAREMKNAIDLSKPVELGHEEWHVPYINRVRSPEGVLGYYTPEGDRLALDDAKVISVSCCAQVSYRKLDMSLSKATMIYHRLYESKPPHMSPFEHVAEPMSHWEWMTRNTAAKTVGDTICLYSGNFMGWVQWRKNFVGECQ